MAAIANRRRLVHRLQPLRRPRVFRDRLNPLDVYNDWEMYERFRFRRYELFQIFDEFSAELEYIATRTGSLPNTVQIMIALRFFATGCFQIVLGDMFGVSKATVHKCIGRVSDVFASHLNRHVYIEQDAIRTTKQKFHAMAGIPNVFGAIDCTHIRLQRPQIREHEFVNRKGYHSLNVQLICDADLLILNCIVNWPGSVHDSRILRQSDLFRAFEQPHPPVEGCLLGDSGYMLKKWLLTPYFNPQPNTPQQRFNDAHASTRCTIERCNGVLKRRWHCLHAELRYQPARAVQIIKACIVLHNIAARLKVPVPEDFFDDGDASMHNNDMDDDDNQDVDICGRLVRDRVAMQYF